MSLVTRYDLICVTGHYLGPCIFCHWSLSGTFILPLVIRYDLIYVTGHLLGPNTRDMTLYYVTGHSLGPYIMALVTRSDLVFTNAFSMYGHYVIIKREKRVSCDIVVWPNKH